jgi:hypothetical protein
MAAGAANMPPPPTNAPGAPPPPPYAMQGTVPFMTPPQPDVSSGPMVVGILGGVLALAGAFIGWLQIQACAGAMGFNMCVAAPLPPTFSLSSFDAFVGMGSFIGLLFGIVGIGLLAVQKPVTGLVAGLVGVVTLVVALIWLSRASALFSTIAASVGGASSSVTVGAGIGLYVSIFGAFMLSLGGIMQWRALKGRARAAATATPPSPAA